jgi:hypothetical protein
MELREAIVKNEFGELHVGDKVEFEHDGCYAVYQLDGELVAEFETLWGAFCVQLSDHIVVKVF